jgi:aerobic carbon-monoxide dehydrogenase small subunit
MRVTMRVDGVEREANDVDGAETLLDTLRERLSVTGPKDACRQGECGSCTVLLDDRPVLACLVLAAQASGRRVTTVAGLRSDGELTTLQRALIEAGAVQCGFCTPGIVVAGHDLLRRNPCPDEQDVREALSGNLCRCTGYQKIVEAVLAAAAQTPASAEVAR